MYKVIFFLVLTCSTVSALDKSGVKPTVLSLPSGPGSIEGLGESFEPELNSGTTHYQIKLALPPGRAGFAPQLALTYNSGFGNGVFGMGWTLSVPYIQCQTDKGLPRYQASGNAYIYSNREELVPVSGGYYRCENEGDFIRFSRDRETGGWLAQLKNGTVYRFGKTLDGRIRDNEGHVFKWLLEEAVDVHGNTMDYVYESRDDSVQKYLARIRYNTNMAVGFTYEARPDILTDYRPTYELKTAFRCSKISIMADSQSVRSYHLLYKPETDSEKISQLASVTLFGKGGINSLPPAEFTYTEFSAAGLSFSTMESAPNLPLSDGSIDLLDVNSDGLPDILRTDNLYQAYYENMGPDESGEVKWSSEKTMGASPKVLDLGSTAIQLADLDGDGKTDVMDLFGEDTQVYHLVKTDGVLSWQAGVNIINRAFDFDDPKVRLCDLNNDKLIDVMRISSGVCSVWLNLGDGTWGSEIQTDFPNSRIDLGDSHYKLGDMNGDRLPDLVYLENEGCRYYPNMGYGTFGDYVNYTRVPWGIHNEDNLFLSDVNGDGLSDAVYVDPYLAKAWINLGLNTDDHSKASFAEFIQVYAPDAATTSSEFRMCDVNGNGSKDILWNTYPSSYQVFAYIDFSPGEQPYQLKTVTNGIGSTATFYYGSSTGEMLRDRDSGSPWTDTLPFPLTVMTAYEQSDGVNTYTTRYTYHNGYYDGLEKEFRGFERAELHQDGDASVESRMESYVFDTGKHVKAKKGKVLAHSVQNGEGDVFFTESRNWQVRTLLAGLNDPRNVAYAYADLMEKTVVEKGLGEPVTIREQYAVDNYGNIIEKTETGRTDAGWDDERITASTYSAGYTSGLNAWILDKVIESRLKTLDDKTLSHTRHYYDVNDTLGEVTKGDLTRVSRWLKDDFYVNTVHHRYDTYGNLRETRDGLFGLEPGHRSFYLYDSTYHTFLEEERFYTAGGYLAVKATWDAGLGVMETSTDLNENVTVYGHDDFGRLRSVTKPGDTVFTEEYRYTLSQETDQGLMVNWVETLKKDDSDDGYLVSRVFYDGLGRKIMTRSEDAMAGQVVVGDVVQFNAQKTPWKTYLPYTETGTLDYTPPEFNPFYATEHTYDGMGRERSTAFYGGAHSRIEYRPLEKIVYDEEQTRERSLHEGCSKRFIKDGLGRLRQVVESVKINDLGVPVDTITDWTTSYTWNEMDLLISYTDSLLNKKHFDYDPLGRKIYMNDPDQGQVDYDYDLQGNLTFIRDAKNQVIRYKYDELNRLSEEYYGEFKTEPDVVYHYDTPVDDVYKGELWGGSDLITLRNALLEGDSGLSPDYDVNGDGVIDVADLVMVSKAQIGSQRMASENTIGRLSRVEDLSGEEILSYDERGRSTWTVKRIKDAAGKMKTFCSAVEYDSMDRVSRRYYPDSSYVSYLYNSRGLLDRIPGVISSMDYYPSGQINNRTMTAGITTHYGYDLRLRLVLLESNRSTDGRKLQDYEYGYDFVSNITRLEDQRADDDYSAMAIDLGVGLAEAKKHKGGCRYVYDSLYRLVSATATDVFGSTTYRTDRIGNMVEKNHGTGNLPVPFIGLGTMTYGGGSGKTGRDGRNPGEPPGPHALTGVSADPEGFLTLSYDNNGNTTFERGMTLSWDYNNRLTHLSDKDTTASYAYDYMGQRKLKQVTGSPGDRDGEVIYIDANSEIRDGKLIKYVYDGTNRIARSTRDGAQAPLEPDQFYLHNHLGTTEAVLDTHGSLKRVYAYYPYGSLRLSLGVNDQGRSDYLFTGKERDDESKLDYFEARYYSSRYGRFNRVDPLLVQLTGDDERLKDVIFDPQKLNVYGYVLNNPLSNIDENGLFTIKAFWQNTPSGWDTRYEFHFEPLEDNLASEAGKKVANKSVKRVIGGIGTLFKFITAKTVGPKQLDSKNPIERAKYAYEIADLDRYLLDDYNEMFKGRMPQDRLSRKEALGFLNEINASYPDEMKDFYLPPEEMLNKAEHYSKENVSFWKRIFKD